MASVKNEMALLNAQQLINVRIVSPYGFASTNYCYCKKCNEKCFQKCVTKPGSSLSSSEEVRLTTLFSARPSLTFHRRVYHDA